ncbi:MAG: hypothetical protein NDJ19_02855 [Ramlibacter sp.]|nr:hypothetical protein [Ramlibacter sp.]
MSAARRPLRALLEAGWARGARLRAAQPWTRWTARSGGWRLPLRVAAAALLAIWTAGLLAAAVQLAAWEDELARTLLQIRADTVFREHMDARREPIPREWYRVKTLALLAASEKLKDDSRWALFVPGSWRLFDPLRQRAATRIERAFSDIAVETVRRELHFRASQLTGVPQDGQTAELVATGDCASPPPVAMPPRAGAAPSELAERSAVQAQLAAIEQLDGAVRAMVALQGQGGADPGHLRLLVRYTLGVELPGQLSRSVGFFRTGLKPEDVTFTARGVPRIQRAVRCSLAKAMHALDARMFERNDLLAAEAFLAARYARLFAPRAAPLGFGETVDAYREVIAALDEQQLLLERPEYGWLHRKGTAAGPREPLLERIAAIGLLGPEAVVQVQRQSAVALERFRRQFGATFGPTLDAAGDAALVWSPQQGRLVLSAPRRALRDGLAALLRQPFMVAPARRAIPADAAGPLSWDSGRLQQALSFGEARRHFTDKELPNFPPGARAAVARFVDAHLADLVQDATVAALLPAGGAAADVAAYRAQHEQLAQVLALLAGLGARDRAEQLRSLLSRELLARLALADAAMARNAIFSDRTRHFGWWRGDGSPVLQAFGVADKLTLRYSLAQQLGQLEDIGREAGAYLPHGGASAAAYPTVQRWQGIVGELKRYRAGAADSSLLALEHYLVAVGAELDRANCVERLSLAAPPAGRTDEFAKLHAQIHNALLTRCVELRSAAAPARAAIPWG